MVAFLETAARRDGNDVDRIVDAIAHDDLHLSVVHADDGHFRDNVLPIFSPAAQSSYYEGRSRHARYNVLEQRH